MRMNQLLAPTSFITSISRLRANMAMRIVLKISTMAAIAPATAMATHMPLRKPSRRCMRADGLVRADDLEHARVVLVLVRAAR